MATVDEGSWGPAILGLTIAFLVLVLLALFLRIVTRVWIVHSFWWDDFTIILAVLGTTIGAGLDFVEVHYGFGKREQYLSPNQLQEFRKYTYGEWIQTFATLMWTKISICLFLMRIPNSKTLLRPLQLAVVFLLFSNTVLTMMWIMQCQPLHAAWDNQGTCMSRGSKDAIVLAQAIISVVSDFTFAAFPIFVLWRVQIDFKTKMGLWVLMCLGFITGACCLVRTVLNNQALPLDQTYDGIINWLWRLFEVQIGIIAACIPTLRPLYKWFMERVRGERVAGVDTNIHFPLTKDKPHSWIEHARKRTDSEHSSETARKRHLDSVEHPDTMKDELVREGILVKEPRHVGADRNNLGKSERFHRDSLFESDMVKYGVDDAA